MFVMSLQPPDTEPPAQSEALQAGEALFMQKCSGCHIPERGYSGELIPASALTSDPSISRSITRGTGFYRAPSLLGLSRGGPYLHDLSAATLDDLLLGGHPTGEQLDETSRADLILFLETL
jgi:mono/diheme cytochrome c family protein